MLAGTWALVFAAVFTGAAIYINVAEHPSRMALDDGAALAQWGPAYQRGFAMQASLALVSTALGLLAFWWTRNLWWFIGSGLIFANWPYTLTAILPLNKRLQAMEPDKPPAEARMLLQRWALLHAGRSALGAAATVSYVVALNG